MKRCMQHRSYHMETSALFEARMPLKSSAKGLSGRITSHYMNRTISPTKNHHLIENCTIQTETNAKTKVENHETLQYRSHRITWRHRIGIFQVGMPRKAVQRGSEANRTLHKPYHLSAKEGLSRISTAAQNMSISKWTTTRLRNNR